MTCPDSGRLEKSLSAWAESAVGQPLSLRPLAGDGGSRCYFRLKGQGLLALAGPNPAENLAWLTIGRHLWFKGLPLPRIYRQDLERGFFILEDLGDQLLARPKNQSDYYPLAAELLARIHKCGLEGFNTAWCWQTKAYVAKMAAEQEVGYFLNSFFSGYLKAPRRPKGVETETRALGRLAAANPEARVLMHRDYQGRNLIARQGLVYVLDWQGARPGPAAYDLVSLLEETPGGQLSEAFKEELISIYLKARGPGCRQKTLRREMVILGAARMMQALGAYGKLTMSGKRKFAAYMKPVALRLKELFGHPLLAGFPALKETVRESVELLQSKGNHN